MIAAQVAGNILETVAQIVPVPYLDTSLAIFKALYKAVQHVRGVRAQMDRLAVHVAELLYELNIKLTTFEHIDDAIRSALEDFNCLLCEICETADKYSKRSYLKIFFTPQDIQGLIEGHNRRMDQVSRNFQLYLQLTVHNDSRKFEEARKADHRDLLGIVQELKQDIPRVVREALEAMRDEYPLTKKEIDYFSTIENGSCRREPDSGAAATAFGCSKSDERKEEGDKSLVMKEESPIEKELADYLATINNSSDERELDLDAVSKILNCLNRASVYVLPQGRELGNTWQQKAQYSLSELPDNSYTAEPAAMTEFESQMPFIRPFRLRRQVYHPVYRGHDDHWSYPQPIHNTSANNYYNQPYNPSQATMQMPTPYHYHSMA